MIDVAYSCDVHIDIVSWDGRTTLDILVYPLRQQPLRIVFFSKVGQRHDDMHVCFALTSGSLLFVWHILTLSDFNLQPLSEQLFCCFVIVVLSASQLPTVIVGIMVVIRIEHRYSFLCLVKAIHSDERICPKRQQILVVAMIRQSFFDYLISLL